MKRFVKLSIEDNATIEAVIYEGNHLLQHRDEEIGAIQINRGHFKDWQKMIDDFNIYEVTDAEVPAGYRRTSSNIAEGALVEIDRDQYVIEEITTAEIPANEIAAEQKEKVDRILKGAQRTAIRDNQNEAGQRIAALDGEEYRTNKLTDKQMNTMMTAILLTRKEAAGQASPEEIAMINAAEEKALQIAAIRQAENAAAVLINQAETVEDVANVKTPNWPE